MRDGTAPPCGYPETQWEGSAAELILESAARREGVARNTLHGGAGSAGSGAAGLVALRERTTSAGGAAAAGFVPREAKCT